jgi:hypothetical protein
MKQKQRRPFDLLSPHAKAGCQSLIIESFSMMLLEQIRHQPGMFCTDLGDIRVKSFAFVFYRILSCKKSSCFDLNWTPKSP